MEILYEDKDIFVCIKPVGVSSENGMMQLIREYLKDNTAYVGIIHRLDTAVSGVMVYAKTKSAAAKISGQIQNGDFKKEYYAVVSGCPEVKDGAFEDLLFKDSAKNKVFVVKNERKGVKRAVLEYSVYETVNLDDNKISLLKIKLKTGRSHQIRVQFASRKMPLLGDGKYGSRYKCNIALFSTAIKFIHPITHEEMHFSALPENIFPFNKFAIKKEL